MYGRGAAYELNPHLAPDSGSDYPCPYRDCDGSGFVIDEETDSAVACRCRAQRIANARGRNLAHEIPRRFQDLALDRNPVREILASLGPLGMEYRDFCLQVERRLDEGRGIWFRGDRGTGKTTLAMLISIHAMRARRTVAIYTAPKLLETIRATYADEAQVSLTELTERLRSVDLLHIEDLAVPKTTDWVLEQLYTIINDRYQDRRSVMFTTDSGSLEELGQRIGHRTVSRLVSMCGDPILMHGEDYRLRPL